MPSCETILAQNPQLRRRFSIKQELKAFKWTSPGATNNEIQALLKVIESQLILKNRSNLSDPDLAYRIYCATGGLINGIMQLIREGDKLAIENETEKITLDILAQVYEEFLASSYPDCPNPFEQNYSDLKPLSQS